MVGAKMREWPKTLCSSAASSTQNCHPRQARKNKRCLSRRSVFIFKVSILVKWMLFKLVAPWNTESHHQLPFRDLQKFLLFSCRLSHRRCARNKRPQRGVSNVGSINQLIKQESWKVFQEFCLWMPEWQVQVFSNQELCSFQVNE